MFRPLPLPLLLLVLAGCASGGGSSFTQAPLFFSEEVDDRGEPVATRDAGTGEGLAAGDFERGVPTFAAVGGNAVLPVRTTVPLTVAATANGPLGPIGAAAALTPDAAVTATVALPGNTTTVAVDPGVTLPSAVAPVISALPAAPAAIAPVTSALAPVVSAVAPAVPTVVPTVTAAVPAVTSTIVPVVPAAVPAVTAAVAPVVTAAGGPLVTAAPVLGGQARAPVAATTNLLSTTATQLVRMCLIVGC